ncbi:rhodanese-like domain-containing protein [Kushneria aurantia]|uniref:Rhodanese-like domain-containing protein n=1 Tax=Kushneria aurantia TaxID=504092 RepID=A0ABV6G1I1_9GAMM|nr:rhodanese-like domain-containing protein [Kushneria aurantia]
MIDQLLEFAQNHLFLVGAFVVVLLAWLSFEARRSASGGVSCGEATGLINRDDAVVLDVREAKEFKAGHIAGAVNIPADKLDSSMNRLEKHRDKPIIVVDKMGQHSGGVVTKLHKAGFDGARRLKGGHSQWQADGLPVVTR